MLLKTCFICIPKICNMLGMDKITEKSEETPKITEKTEETPKITEKTEETPKITEKTEETPKITEKSDKDNLVWTLNYII